MFCSCDVKLPKVCVVKAMVVIDVCVYRESTWISGNEHPSSPKRCSVESLKVFLVNKTNQYPKPTLARVQEPYFWGCCGLSMLTGSQSVMLCGCCWTMLNSWSPRCGLLGSTIFFIPKKPHGPNRQGWRIDDSSDESVGLDHDMGMTAASFGVQVLGPQTWLQLWHWPSAVSCWWWAEICLERTNQQMQGGYTRRSTRTIPLPIGFSLSCFNKEPATGGSGLFMPCRIFKRSFYPESCASHPLPTWFFRWAWRLPSWKIHRKMRVFQHTHLAKMHHGSLPVARSRMRDLQDLACRLKERGQHLASCLCGMETGGQTRSYNPQKTQARTIHLVYSLWVSFPSKKGYATIFPDQLPEPEWVALVSLMLVMFLL